MRRLIGAAAVLAAFASVTSTAPTLAARANQTVVEVGIDDCVVRGSGAPRHGKVTIERRSSDGTLRTRETVASDMGYFATAVPADCFQYGAGVQPGDIIKTTVGGDTRKFVVPHVTVRIDRDTDTAMGIAPSSGTLTFGLLTTGPDGNAYSGNAHIRPDSSWSVDFQKRFGVNVRGWDEVDVGWTDARGNHVFNSNVAPGVEVAINRPAIWLAGQAGTNSQLKLLDAPGCHVIARTSGVVYAGKNVFLWLDDNGESVAQREGNRVITDVASDASFTIPAMATTINKRSDVVALATGLGAGLEVSMYIDGDNGIGFGEALTDSAGDVAIDFGGDPHGQPIDIVAGEQVAITLRLSTGDIVDKTITVE